MHMKWDALHSLVPFVQLIKFVQFLRTWKALMEECYFNKVAGFSQIVQSNHAWVFFMVFKLYKWYQIALSIANNWKAEACNFDRSNTPPWVFFMFLKLFKWYHIALSITNNKKPETCNFTKRNTPPWVFFMLNYRNGTKSC